MPPNQPPDPAAPTCGIASRPVIGNPLAASRISGAALPQDCGTESPPTDAARPRPADAAAPPDPYDPTRVDPAPAGTSDASDIAIAGAAAAAVGASPGNAAVIFGATM